jgi:hypothetical protein
VERGSDKHGPRVDDELDHETRSREALLADAEGNHATDEVLERLRALPAGRANENVQDVWSALGGTVEHRF